MRKAKPESNEAHLNKLRTAAMEGVMELMFTMMLQGYIHSSTFRMIRNDLCESLRARFVRNPPRKVSRPKAKRRTK
jgi:hypothetical protein